MATSDKNRSLKDIISKSLLIKSGPPNRYQLVPKKQSLDGRKEEESKLRRWTIGERNPSTANKTVLLVGDRGAGKSTLINTMVNYVMGVKWEDKVWFEIIEEEKQSLPQSWTSEVIVYDILGFEGLALPYSLTIVDTPGYEDPKWNKKDKEVIEKLHNLFRSKDGIDQIDVVGLVMKATKDSLSAKQKYIFDEVATFFGKTMRNNIVALLTHSDGGPAINALQALKTADIRCARDEKNQPVHFLFNIGQTVTTTSQLDMSSMRNALNTNMDGMEEFLEFLGELSPKELKRKSVPTEHEEVEAALQEKNRFAFVPTPFQSIVHQFDSLKDEPDTTRTEVKPRPQISNSAAGRKAPETKPRSKLSTNEKDTTTPGAEAASQKIIRKCGNPRNIADIISKSTLFHSGPPKRYQLVPKKQCLDGRGEGESKVRRWTIGEKDHSKVNRTVLMVGETGAGKTTLINAMINHVMGVEREDQAWFEIIEEGKTSQAESQTSEVIAYDIFGFEGGRLPYSLTVIDTPGYGDTRGIQEDRLIAEMLHDLFRSPEGINQIDAVGFVVKATENRLSDRQRYIFDAVVSLFGKDMENQIVALISNSDGGPADNALQALKNAKIPCAKKKNKQPVHFLFNNRQTEIVRNSKQEKAMSLAWDITKEGMDEFFDFLNKVCPQKLKLTVDVLTKRIQLEAFVNNLYERILMIEGKQSLLRQTRNELKKYRKEINDNKNFAFKVTETYKEKELIKQTWTKKAVCCLVCEENCHYPGCTIARSPAWCEVMKGGLCTACAGKCPVSNHIREDWIYVQKTREITRTHDDLKKKYQENVRAAGEKADLLTCLKKDLNKAVEDKASLVEESYQCVVELEEIALRCNALSTYVHLDFLIAKLKEKGEMEKAGKLEKMQSCAEEGQKKGMKYLKTALGIFWPGN